jgi:hypothetical protein
MGNLIANHDSITPKCRQLANTIMNGVESDKLKAFGTSFY